MPSAGAAIAFVGPLSGPFAWVGEGLTRSIDLAIRHARDDGGAGGSVRLRAHDSGGDPALAAEHSRALAEDADVVALVGPTFSREVEAGAEPLDAAGLPFLVAVATKPELGSHGWSCFFRVVASDATRAPVTARFLAGRGARRAALVRDGSDSARRVSELARPALEREGIDVVCSAELRRDDDSYLDAAAVLVEAAPDAVVFGGEYREAGLLLRELAARLGPVAFVGDDGVLTPRFVEAAGPAAEGAFVTFPGADAAVAAPRLHRDFRAEHGAEPPAFAAEAYAAATLVLAGLAERGPSRDGVREFVRAFSGEIAGRELSFGPDGENRRQAFFAYEVRDGRWSFRTGLALDPAVPGQPDRAERPRGGATA